MRGSRRGWGEVGSSGTPFETKFNFGHRVHSTESRENRDGNSQRKMSLAVTRSSSSSSPPSPQPPTTTTTITTITLDDSTLGRRLIRVEQVIYLFISFRYFSFGIFSEYRVERSWLGFKKFISRTDVRRDCGIFFFFLLFETHFTKLLTWKRLFVTRSKIRGDIRSRKMIVARFEYLHFTNRGREVWMKGRKGMGRVPSFGKITVGLLILFFFYDVGSYLSLVHRWFVTISLAKSRRLLTRP